MAAARTPAIGTLVADVEGASRGATDNALGAAQVDHLGARVEKDAGDRRVARHTLHGGCGDGAGTLHLACRRPHQVEERLQRRCDLHVRPLAGALRDGAAVERMRTQFDERVREALLSRPAVIRVGTDGERFEGSSQQCAALRIKEPGDGHAVLAARRQLERAPVVSLELRSQESVAISPVTDMGA
jgi:hypothetical protein